MATVMQEEVVPFLGTVDEPLHGGSKVLACGHPLGVVVTQLSDVSHIVAELLRQERDEGVRIVDATSQLARQSDVVDADGYCALAAAALRRRGARRLHGRLSRLSRLRGTLLRAVGDVPRVTFRRCLWRLIVIQCPHAHVWHARIMAEVVALRRGMGWFIVVVIRSLGGLVQPVTLCRSQGRLVAVLLRSRVAIRHEITVANCRPQLGWCVRWLVDFDLLLNGGGQLFA
mmetsp:Transcript_130653/g.418976  ORF Transcript_130653/g.418976 Transcript_130653/m.418976 type:complete len:229 (-) Transcript_130653:995-1681(-)